MREKRTVQSSIFHFFADHEIGRELQAISNWLDSSTLSYSKLHKWQGEDIMQHIVLKG